MAVIVATYTSIQVVGQHTIGLDDTLADLFVLVPDSMNPFFLLVTELGDKKGIYLVAIFALGWLLMKRNLVGAAAIILSVALGNEMNKLLKDLIARPRPDLEHLAPVNSNSFPSGHAMVGFIVYFFLAYLIIEEVRTKSRKVIVALLAGLLLLLIGASRIILNVHYPSDVIGGYAFGYIWVFIWILLYQYFKKKFKKS
ncbi:phosphatase PAP2 family protein [Neobacillus sp. FSL H8-0543]|uniref:phosphatase PAP2 family protein n=1 Tax=Neobacillus sp. FSL H8-0543 TaxID=2954672 RepID=UPI00315834F3